jgi:hypothetical protein
MKLLVFVLAAAACCGQTGIEVQLPSTVPSETFFVRYCITGESGHYCNWIESKPNVRSYSIDATYAGQPAVSARAILYAPGCGIETFDFTAAELQAHPHYSFTCRPLPAISITGELERIDRFHGEKIALRARYIAYWAAGFFGTTDGMVVSIPVGNIAYPSADNHFRLSLPDFSQDPLAGARDHAGSLQIWATDRADGNPVALLVLAERVSAIKTKMGGLRIQDTYPPKLVFTPCTANPEPIRDQFGFTLRPRSKDACDQ